MLISRNNETLIYLLSHIIYIDIFLSNVISAGRVTPGDWCQDANYINEDALQCYVWTVSAMTSTGPSTGPCSS